MGDMLGVWPPLQNEWSQGNMNHHKLGKMQMSQPLGTSVCKQIKRYSLINMDTVVKNHVKKAYLLRDTTVPSDKNT